MKYLKLFENFEEGHKFDILDLFIISPSEVKELFFRELRRTPLDMENIQVFLDSGLVDVNTKGGEYDWTPLHLVAIYNNLELAKLLISSGAKVNEKDKWGFTPLRVAAGNNHQEMRDLLISHGGVQ